MLNRHARRAFTKLFTPLAALLLRLRISPDAVTLGGTLGVSLAALILFPLGQLFWGVVVITVFVFSDVVDGIMARLAGRAGTWGGFLDSTLDRIQDGAVFAGLAFWFFGAGGSFATGALALTCLALGNLVSYVRAKAESLGFDANVGIAERAERLVSTLVVAGLVGLGLPVPFLTGMLAILAVASAVTVCQRVFAVRTQAAAGGAA
ncbi:CDP-alcohol phosphatidyltransferase [Sinomonas cellulolyticus]|uniref:Phosphatidylinositol phosphate synthase n=1 Tax=Sinomonas cellulolyticus TaxID=2801916 RepID=A0ABS1K102_9MICC|nr:MULTISPECIES: CDP-alcohol phosphatidyltransferase family protein [Sinomonas]MBL0705153.1 CDP-alcohol phosphatidyltransferase family protein [Sinomonas cellulolyticus]GHG39564.1 CDP-alcohol phosphatidyltransferase [Sinomonas sp. KCTC 49339]